MGRFKLRGGLFVAAVASVLIAGGAAAIPAAAQGDCARANVPATGLTIPQLREAVRCLINQQRATYGLPPLGASNRLDRVAQHWSVTMVAGDIFNHHRVRRRLAAAGVKYRIAGENIATGQRTPQQVVSAWMGSLDHCQNILSPVYTQIGTGISLLPVLGYATGPSTWTQDFDLPIGQRAPSENWAPADGCPY